MNLNSQPVSLYWHFVKQIKKGSIIILEQDCFNMDFTKLSHGNMLYSKAILFWNEDQKVQGMNPGSLVSVLYLYLKDS